MQNLTQLELKKYAINSRAKSPLEFVSNCVLFFLQTIFSAREKGNYHYDSDETKTEILICDEFADLSMESNFPAIIYIRGPLSNESLTLHNSFGSLDLIRSKSSHLNILEMSFTLLVIHRNPSQAETIASEIFTLFKAFSNEIRKLGFASIKSNSIGEIQIIHQDGIPGLYIVPISLSCQLADEWDMSPLATAKLREILINKF